MWKLRSLVILSLLVIGAVASAQCDYEPGRMYVGKARWATVKRVGVTLFGIPVGAGGLDADDRAWVIANQRLDVLLGHRVLTEPRNIRVGRMGSEVVIYVRNPRNVGGLGTRTLILTVDRNFERYLGRNRWDIAYYWRDLMRKWSNAGVMRAGGDNTDPLGRPLDPERSWLQIPEGYAADYATPDDEGPAVGGGCSATPCVPAPAASSHGAWGVPGD